MCSPRPGRWGDFTVLQHIQLLRESKAKKLQAWFSLRGEQRGVSGSGFLQSVGGLGRFRSNYCDSEEKIGELLSLMHVSQILR